MREREREGEKERGRERKRERDGGRERKRERDGGRERAGERGVKTEGKFRERALISPANVIFPPLRVFS